MKTHVVKITLNASLAEAVDLMDLYQVNGLPVVDENEILCGILTERDVLRALTKPSADRAKQPEQNASLLPTVQPSAESADTTARRLLTADAVTQKLVCDYMTSPAISVSEHAEAEAAARALLTNHLKRLPVTDERGRVVGVLNRIDVFQAIIEQSMEV